MRTKSIQKGSKSIADDKAGSKSRVKTGQVKVNPV